MKKQINSCYKISIDEFWKKYEQKYKQSDILGIHTKTREQADILMRVFDKMGKKWITGTPYTELSCFDEYKGDTIYYNNHLRGSLIHAMISNLKYFEFEEIDMEKYLNLEDKNIVQRMAISTEKALTE